MKKSSYIPPKSGKKNAMLKSRSKSIISHDPTVTDNAPKTARVGANTQRDLDILKQGPIGDVAHRTIL